MAFPLQIAITNPKLFNGEAFNINLNSGLTALIGPNGSGKTNCLRAIQQYTITGNNTILNGKKLRYLAAGRFGFLENFRANIQGYNNINLNVSAASFGTIDQGTRRQAIETALGDYQALNQRPDILLKVRERLRVLFKRDLQIFWANGQLYVRMLKLGSGSEYHSAEEASGLLHIISLLAAIYDDEVSILLIDEPEVSLHPQLQAFFLSEMKKVAGDPQQAGKKLIIYSTHSTEFISMRRPEDICNMVFFNDSETPPAQLNIADGLLRSGNFRTLLLQMGSLEKSAFFAKSPLLVEGPTDLQVCAALENKLNLYLGVAGCQMIPVNGTGNMGVSIEFFRKLGKTPVVLTDIDSFADGMSVLNSLKFTAEQNEIAIANGATSIIELARNIHQAFLQAIQNFYTDIQGLVEANDIWVNRDQTKPAAVYQRRAVLSTILNMDARSIAAIPNSFAEWRILKTRIDVILNVLEDAGCFILRKGYIENYYQFANITGRTDKTKMAAEEVEGIETNTLSAINLQGYGDIIRCLEFAAHSPVINEVHSVISDVLSITAPALFELTETSSNQDMQAIAKRVIGDKGEIFKLSVDQTGTQPMLVIDAISKILDVTGFPIRIFKNGNPNIEIPANLRSSS